MGEIYAICINKGGVGKTSLTTNLAGAINETMKKKKILIVDVDGQGSSSEAFGYEPDDFEKTVYDVLLGEEKVEDVIIKINKNLHILPSNQDMNFIDFNILPEIEKYPFPTYFHLLKNALEKVKDDYDYILIDTPPSMSLTMMNVLAFADKVVIPVVPELFAVKGLPRILRAINDFKTTHNPSLEIAGIVLMMVDYRTTLHQKYAPMIKQFCESENIDFFKAEIKNSIRYSDSFASEGKPATMIKKLQKREPVSNYFELVKEMFQ